jgi:pyruvate kinase
VLEDIVRLSDSIMVARGDLGVEFPPEEVPGRQKEMIRLCRQAGKPVIVATQMLESMVVGPTPTRAEVSDVATAIYDGADCVMLSAESASGKYPVEAVATMARIICSTERHKYYRSTMRANEPTIDQTPSHAVAGAGANLAETLGAAAVVAFTATGTTAMRVSRQRPEVPILALTPNETVSRQLSLLWGVHSVRSDDIENVAAMVEQSKRIAADEGFARESDVIVVVAGVPFGSSGHTNNIRVVRMNE